MALNNEIIQNKLMEKFGDQVFNFSSASGILSFESSKEMNLKVLQYLDRKSTRLNSSHT